MCECVERNAGQGRAKEERGFVVGNRVGGRMADRAVLKHEDNFESAKVWSTGYSMCPEVGEEGRGSSRSAGEDGAVRLIESRLMLGGSGRHAIEGRREKRRRGRGVHEKLLMNSVRPWFRNCKSVTSPEVHTGHG